jgi:hypothetical protein
MMTWNPYTLYGGWRMKKQIKRERRALEERLRKQTKQIEERGEATVEAAKRGQTAVLRQTTRLLAGIAAITVLIVMLPSKKKRA